MDGLVQHRCRVPLAENHDLERSLRRSTAWRDIGKCHKEAGSEFNRSLHRYLVVSLLGYRSARSFGDGCPTAARLGLSACE